MFNMNNKKVGREVMQNAAKFNLMPYEQGGLVKNQRANYSLLEKVIRHDIHRSRKWTYSIISNDMKLYYNRTVGVCRPFDTVLYFL